jgi:hypothetical protein
MRCSGDLTSGMDMPRRGHHCHTARYPHICPQPELRQPILAVFGMWPQLLGVHRIQQRFQHAATVWALDCLVDS